MIHSYIHIGMYVVYIVVFVAGTLNIDYKNAQVICCLFPPLALQVSVHATHRYLTFT
jgi:hypothetical protein